jgi:hypothetical protein
MNKITITDLVTTQNDKNTKCSQSFETRTGLSNIGVGRFLVQKPTSDPTQPISLTIESESINGNTNSRTISCKSTAIIPKSVNYLISNNTSDIYEIILYDQRDDNTRFKKLISRRYNVLDPTTGSWELSSLKTPSSLTEWTWTQIFADLEVTVDPAITLPTWNPKNIILNNLPKNIAVDKVASELQLVVGWDYATDEPKIYEIDQLTSTNSALQTQASNYIINKPALTKIKRYDTRLPKYIKVCFPIYKLGGIYGHDIEVNANGSGTYVFHYANYFAEKNTAGTITNLTAITAVATDIANKLYTRFSTTVDEREYIGIWPFDLDGQIRSIKWIIDENGARTIISRDNLNDYETFVDLKKNNSIEYKYDGIDGLDIYGLGSTSKLLIPAIPRIKYASVYSVINLKNGFTNYVIANPCNIGNDGGTTGVNIDTSKLLRLKVNPKATTIGMTITYGNIVGYLPFVSNLEKDSTITSTDIFDGLVISGAGETGGQTIITPATTRYQVLAANDTDLLFKPDWVRYHA